jgi:WD40 repeat protein
LEKVKFHIVLAGYYYAQPHFFDGDQQKKPHIRKCMELPFQQTKAEMWNEVTDTICDLEFIQAMACAKMTYELVKDFNAVLKEIPDNAHNINEENEQQARLDKYAKDLVLYAKGEITTLKIPETIPFWGEEKINEEIERMKINPSRTDRLNNFINFLGHEAINLQNFACEFPHFALQQAWNYTDGGPVGNSATKGDHNTYKSLLLCISSSRPPWIPHPQSIFILKGHKDCVTAVAVTSDGKRAITGSKDKTCIIWDLSTGQAISILEGHTQPVNAVAITPDGKRAISGSNDYTCIIWDLTSYKAIYTLKGHTFYVTAVDITPDGNKAVSGSHDQTCIIWNLKSGLLISILKEQSSVDAVVISSDGKKVITGSLYDTYTLWDLASGQVMKTIGSNDAFRDSHTGKLLEGKSSNIHSLAITPDGKWAITGSYIGCTIWNLKTGKEICVLKGHGGDVNAVAVTPDGKRAISGSHDYTCIVWDLNTYKAIYSLKGHTSFVRAVAITPDGKRGISGSDDSTCIIWDLQTGQKMTPINVPTEKYNFRRFDDKNPVLATTTNGQKAISGSKDNTCILWDLNAGKTISTLIGHTSRITSVAITPDGNRALTGSWDHTCFVWDLNTGQPINTLKGHTFFVNAIDITRDGKRGISGSMDNTCIIWDLNTGKPINTFVGHTKDITSVAITPDNKRLVTSSWDKTSIIWNINTGRQVNTLVGHNDHVNAITITPNGKMAISGSDDNTCIIWDLKTGHAIKTTGRFAYRVLNIAITPDGKRASFGSNETNFIIWDVENGKKVGLFVTNSNVYSASFYPGGVIGSEGSGKIFILKANKEILCPLESIVTIKRIWDFKLQQYLPLSADCPLCGHRFEPSSSVLATIDTITKKSGLRPDQSPCLELPDEAWEDPGLLGNCPKCGAALKFNPFIAGGNN